jgi:hypothetical protein
MFAVECLLFYVKKEHTHESESVVTLQNCMADLQDESDSFSGTLLTSSGDGNQFPFVDVEDYAEYDVVVVDNPWPSSSAIIQPGPAISCVFVCVHVMHIGQISRVFCHTVCLSTELFGLL